MQLLSNDMSPFGRKVRIVIAELGLGDRVEMVETRPRDRPEDVTGVNALGKIPVLITDDRQPVHDSAVICDYLDTAFGGSRLVPPDRRWQVLTTMSAADGIIDAAILIRNERLRPQAQQSSDWVDWQLEKVRRSLDAFDARADALSATFDLGVIALGCALTYVPMRLPDFAGFPDWPALARLAAVLGARPSFAATAPS